MRQVGTPVPDAARWRMIDVRGAALDRRGPACRSINLQGRSLHIRQGRRLPARLGAALLHAVHGADRATRGRLLDPRVRQPPTDATTLPVPALSVEQSDNA